LSRKEKLSNSTNDKTTNSTNDNTKNNETHDDLLNQNKNDIEESRSSISNYTEKLAKNQEKSQELEKNYQKIDKKGNRLMSDEDYNSQKNKLEKERSSLISSLQSEDDKLEELKRKGSKLIGGAKQTSSSYSNNPEALESELSEIMEKMKSVDKNSNEYKKLDNQKTSVLGQLSDIDNSSSTSKAYSTTTPHIQNPQEIKVSAQNVTLEGVKLSGQEVQTKASDVFNSDYKDNLSPQEQRKYEAFKTNFDEKKQDIFTKQKEALKGVTDPKARETIRQTFAADLAEAKRDFRTNVSDIASDTPASQPLKIDIGNQVKEALQTTKANTSDQIFYSAANRHNIEHFKPTQSSLTQFDATGSNNVFAKNGQNNLRINGNDTSIPFEQFSNTISSKPTTFANMVSNGNIDAVSRNAGSFTSMQSLERGILGSSYLSTQDVIYEEGKKVFGNDTNQVSVDTQQDTKNIVRDLADTMEELAEGMNKDN